MKASGRTFSATSRSSLVSLACHTSPIPPWPILAVTSYGPSVVPGWSGMALDPGTTLGPYQVTAKIGEGGMGEMYRARDTKLDRDVALKVLPQAFTDARDWSVIGVR